MNHNASAVASDRPVFVQFQTRRRHQAVVTGSEYLSWRSKLPARDILIDNQYFSWSEDLDELIRVRPVSQADGAAVGRLLGTILPKARDARMIECPACGEAAPHLHFEQGICKSCQANIEWSS